MIKTIEDLERVLKLLREQGVTSFKYEEMNIVLGDLPQAEEVRAEEERKSLPTQSQLDMAVGLPVSGFDDPFLDYSVNQSAEGEDIQ